MRNIYVVICCTRRFHCIALEYFVRSGIFVWKNPWPSSEGTFSSTCLRFTIYITHCVQYQRILLPTKYCPEFSLRSRVKSIQQQICSVILGKITPPLFDERANSTKVFLFLPIFIFAEMINSGNRSCQRAIFHRIMDQ